MYALRADVAGRCLARQPEIGDLHDQFPTDGEGAGAGRGLDHGPFDDPRRVKVSRLHGGRRDAAQATALSSPKSSGVGWTLR